MTKYHVVAGCVFLVSAAFFIAGCSGKAETSRQVTPDFNVERLFTHEGCTVYRFKDAGYNRYYTTCQGSTDWSQSRGKSGTTPNSITTEVKK